MMKVPIFTIRNTTKKVNKFIPRNCLLCILFTISLFLMLITSYVLGPFYRIKIFGEITDFSDANNITGYHYFIVPNIVHFIHFKNNDLSFIEVVTIRAAYLHQKPEKIIIHCDCRTLHGKYWDMVKNISNLEIQFLKQPTHIFGKPLSTSYRNFHSSDVARIEVLMKYGGIYLDSDTYIVKSLDPFRMFEMAIGWPPNQFIGTQVLVAHKNARFLRLWLSSYKHYDESKWYYNAGELPTTSVLYQHPELVHRVPDLFGVQNLVHMLYATHSSEWKNYFTIHVLIRHKSYMVPLDPIKKFDVENIKAYNKTFGDMARLALYGTTEMII